MNTNPKLVADSILEYQSRYGGEDLDREGDRTRFEGFNTSHDQRSQSRESKKNK